MIIDPILSIVFLIWIYL